MSYSAASAILQGKLLIEPGYALAQLPLIMQMLKDQVSDRGALHSMRIQKSFEMVSNMPSRRVLTVSASYPVFCVTPYTSVDRLPFDTIVMIDIIGPIFKYGSWFGWGTAELTDLIIRMANSDKVKGIILNIDCPGGQAAGIADLSQTIRSVSKVKPILAIVQDGMAASAAVWIASAAQEIYVTQPTDMFGSIGAYQNLFDLSKYFESLGVIDRDIYAPQSEDKNLSYRLAIEGDDSLIKEELKFLVDYFISNVKSNRAGRIVMQDKEPFTGKLYYANDAIKLGLIDGIKPLTAVVSRLEQLIALRA